MKRRGWLESIFLISLVAVLLGAATTTGLNPNLAFHRNVDWVLLADDKPMYLGWSSDFDLAYDSTNARLELEPLAANNVFRIGGDDGTGIDVQFMSNAGDNNALVWDASAAALTTSGTAVLKAGGDLYITDDLFVGDDADIDGLIVVDETISSTGSITTAGDVGMTDDLFVGDDGVVEDDLTVDGDLATTTVAVGGGTVLSGDWVASGTISAGATSCTITLGTTPVIASDYIFHSCVPATIGQDHAGYGGSYVDLEGGTTAEVRITSATYINLAAYIRIVRK